MYQFLHDMVLEMWAEFQHFTSLAIDTAWQQFASYSQLIVKGLLIGIIASAPMGPVGILCIRRTLQKGRIYGLVTGAGAALSDIIYALITGAGVAVVANFIEDAENIFWLKVVGAVLLFAFGLHMFLSKPKDAPAPSDKPGNGTLFQNFITAFLLTVSNPLIIFLFLATFNMLTFVVPDHWFQQTVGYLSIVGGAMLWWSGLTYVITKMSHRMGPQIAVTINRLIGSIVVVVSILYAANTLFKLSLPFFFH